MNRGGSEAQAPTPSGGTTGAEPPRAWRQHLRQTLGHDVTDTPWWRALRAFEQQERATTRVWPAADETFAALETTPPAQVRVVVLGQDPYPTAGHAHGLAFSVRHPTPPPRSLVNIFRELEADLGGTSPSTGELTGWAAQGVLLLNSVLTVREGAAGSHQGRGWERLTDAILQAISLGPTPVVFLLWGAAAQKKRVLLDEARHTVIMSPHPSPLSARRGFFGSRPFSRANAALVATGLDPIDWGCLGKR